MIAATFETWFKDQLANGLVDIKFAITAGKDASIEAIQGELLAAEACISAGFTRAAPRPISVIPDEILGTIGEVVLH